MPDRVSPASPVRMADRMNVRLDHSRDIATRMPRVTRFLLWLFARRLNRDVFYPVVARAHERGVINSYQLHEVLADFDPTQRGAVGFVTERRAS
jgi:hypothetical protein